MLEWFHQNMSWLFSGLGVAVLGGIATLLFKRGKEGQMQRSGDNSLNIQAGRDVRFHNK